MAKPNFESPVHNPTDILENDLRVYMAPGSEIWRQWLKQSDIPEYRKIAESMIIPADDSNYHAMTRNELLTQRTHAVIKSYMIPGELRLTTQYNPYRENYKYNRGRGYYRIVLLYRI